MWWFKIGDRLNPTEVRASASNATPKNAVPLFYSALLFFKVKINLLISGQKRKFRRGS
jgi:hypothetical protein